MHCCPALHCTPLDYTAMTRYSSLYDTRKPIDIMISKISKKKLLPAPVDLVQETFSF